MTQLFDQQTVLAGRGPGGSSLAAPWRPDAHAIRDKPTDLIVDAQAPEEEMGTLPSLQAAVDQILRESLTTGTRQPRIVHIRAGFYPGPVLLPSQLPPVHIYGAEVDQVTIAARIDAAMSGEEYARRFGAAFAQAHPLTRAMFAKIAAREQIGTHNTAVLRIASDDTTLTDITIRNDYACDRATAAPTGEEPDAEGRFAHGQHQAVALHCAGADRIHLKNLRLSSFQDTLYLQAASPFTGSNKGKTSRVCLEDCNIEGDVDFIFGGATAYFSRCEIRARGQRGAPIWVTAPSTAMDMPYGFVFAHCRFTHDGAEAGQKGGSFLGRQWFEGVRASPYGTPSDPNYICRLTDVNRLVASDGQISSQTLKSVGKCAVVRCEIGAHIDLNRPWDSWAGPEWSPRFRPVQTGVTDFRRYLTPWLLAQGCDLSELPKDAPWLQLIQPMPQSGESQYPTRTW